MNIKVEVKQEEYEDNDVKLSSSEEEDEQQQQIAKTQVYLKQENKQTVSKYFHLLESEKFIIQDLPKQQEQIIEATTFNTQLQQYNKMQNNITKQLYYIAKNDVKSQFLHVDLQDQIRFQEIQKIQFMPETKMMLLPNSLCYIVKDDVSSTFNQLVIKQGRSMSYHIKRQIIDTQINSILYINLLSLQKQLVKECKTLKNTLYQCNQIINRLVQEKFQQQKYILILTYELFNQDLYIEDPSTYQENRETILGFLASLDNYQCQLYVIQDYDIINDKKPLQGTIFIEKDFEQYKINLIQSDTTIQLNDLNVNLLNQNIDKQMLPICDKNTNNLYAYTKIRDTKSQVNCYFNLSNIENIKMQQEIEGINICYLNNQTYIINSNGISSYILK